MGSANTDLATLPAMTGDNLAGLVKAGAAVDAAMLLLDADETIVWSNTGQRVLMPAVDYDAAPTYPELFHASLERGFVGNPLALARPAEFLAALRWYRAETPLSLNINRYPWGDMVVSTRRLDCGRFLLTRFRTHAAAAGILPEQMLLEAERFRRQADALRQALDGIEIGIAIIDTAGRQAFANAALRAIADAGLGLRRLDGVLQPACARDRARWVMALAAASTKSQSVMLADVDGQPCIAATISPSEHSGALLLFAAPLRPNIDQPVCDALGSLLDVTPTQAAIVAELAAGRTITDIAAGRGRSRNTIYNHFAGARQALRDIGIAVDEAAGIAAMAAQVAAITPRPGRALITTTGDDDAGD